MAKLKSNQLHLPSGALITERALLFQTDMVQAVLDGRKTQTRRMKGLESKNDFPNNWHREGNPMKNLCRLWDSTKEENPNPIELSFGFKIKGWRYWDDIAYIKSIYGKPGDLLWVREKMIKNNNSNTYWPVADGYVKTANYEKVIPSIHMPKDACRIWLMVEEIRVERLQEISEEDARAEGIEPIDQHGRKVWKRYDGYNIVTYQPYVSFWSLWASINGEESWDSNPWVWVVKFRVLSKTGRPSMEEIEKAYEQVTNPLRDLEPLDGAKRKEASHD